MSQAIISPEHPALKEYYGRLQSLGQLHKTHEQATRLAFTMLLETLSKPVGWTLVLEETLANRKRPDGALKDKYDLPRGHWEAKDLDDDLDAEIAAKKKKDYPLGNIIFENTRRAVLYQNGREAGHFDITQPHQLAFLLTQFFNHTDEDIEGFHAAVVEFQTRIPTLAAALQKIIAEEPVKNPAFRRAFDTFHELCKSALNPAIKREAIEEMLVQHLLTERLFRTVFNNPDFTSRNVIAAEIEQVIATLISRSFNRQEFLRSLDPLYREIEKVGSKISDWSEKQQFLNQVYERFFQGYSVNQADTMGIVYTPQPIVDWMCASVEEVLKIEFGSGLSRRGVQILDPCTGTGNFIVNILRHYISGADLKHKYANDIFCNEIMLLPYYIASMNIEHEYFMRAQEYSGFEGICFADTLDLNEVNLFSEENTERIKREKAAEITVIIGNPPYNFRQQSENDNNKNRKYDVVDKGIRETYAKASTATNKNALSDPYVKFFRWATDRLGKEDGAVCFVSNNSFIDQNAFDGMRKHLAQDFNHIYHIDLHGNVRKNPKLSGTTHNVFGIQVGVGITVAVRNSKSSERFIKYFRVPETWRKTEKLAWLAEVKDVNGIQWNTLKPDIRNIWLTEGLQEDFPSFLPMGTKETKAHWGVTVKAIFKNYGGGVKTNRDQWAYDFNRCNLKADVQRFIETYNSEFERWNNRDKSKLIDIDEFVTYDDTKIKWSRDLKLDLQRGHHARFDESKIRSALYRPFCKQFLFFDRVLNEEVYVMPKIFPTADTEQENTVICVSGVGNDGFQCQVSNHIVDLKFSNPTNGGTQCFPFYTYAEDGSNRTENITDWALQQFREKYGEDVNKRDIFHYVYAVLHHPQYREKYAENLKRELPRIPLIGDAATFRVLADTGAKLADLHLHYETAPEYPLRWVENKDVPFSWRVQKMKLTPDKSTLIVNSSLTLEGIPPEALRYRLGNRSALEWIVDQYQVKTDARSGLVSDPNREDDEEYIVRLVGRVVTVSVETQKLVDDLPSLD